MNGVVEEEHSTSGRLELSGSDPDSDGRSIRSVGLQVELYAIHRDRLAEPDCALPASRRSRSQPLGCGGPLRMRDGTAFASLVDVK